MSVLILSLSDLERSMKNGQVLLRRTMRSLRPAVQNSLSHHHKGGLYAPNSGSHRLQQQSAGGGTLDQEIFEFVSESYKFIRMADDLHDVASYLNEMRICFLLLTGTVYVILAVYFVCWCIRRNHRQVNSARRVPNHRWDMQGDEYQNAITAQTNVGQTASDDLVSVRSDGAVPGSKGAAGAQHIGGAIGTVPGGGLGAVPQFGMGGRAGGANRQAAPSFMRHSGAAAGAAMQNHRWWAGNVLGAAGTQAFEEGCSGQQHHHHGAPAAAQSAAVAAPITLHHISATTRLMADTDTGTVTKQQHLPPPAHVHLTAAGTSSGTVHAHHQHLQQQQHHSPSSTAVSSEPSPSSTARLLNNIAESTAKEKEATTAATSQQPQQQQMATFGVRSRERVLLERHELQQPSSTTNEVL